MANTFGNVKAQLTDTEGIIYSTSVDPATTGIVIGLALSNRTASLVYVSMRLDTTSLLDEVPIPAGSTLNPLDGKLVVQAGEVLRGVSSDAYSVDVVLSYMEQS